MQLNRADMIKIWKQVVECGIDSFTVVKHSETSIGYLIDLEFVDQNTKELRRVPVVTYSDW
jgi:hypothetical protein